MPRLITSLAVSLAIVTLACSKERAPASSDAPSQAPTSSSSASPVPAQSSKRPVQIEMKNVRLHADEGIVLDVRHLRGEMVSKVPGQPPVFDDQRSYVLHVHAADIAMDMTSLTNLMNRHVFAYEHSPLSDVKVEIDEGRLKLKATLHKGIPVPISMKADVLATPDGRMQLKTEKVSALSVPAKKLMSLFGLELDDVVSLKRKGVEVQDNDVIIAPGLVLPPPEIQGRLTRVAIVNGRLEQTFGSPSGARAGDADAARSHEPELRLLLRLRHSIREAHDERVGPAAHRQRSERPIRFFPREIQRPARRRLFEEHAVGWVEDLHAGLRGSKQSDGSSAQGERPKAQVALSSSALSPRAFPKGVA